MKRPLPVHPVLLALAPVLFAYAHNVRSIPIPVSELALPLAVSLGLSLGLWGLLILVVRDMAKAALITSLFLLLFFLYGHVQATLRIEGPQHGFLVAGCLAAVIVGARFTFRARGSMSGLTVALNFAGLVIVLMNLLLMLPGLMRRANSGSRTLPASAALTSELPDIYYVVLDAYLRADYLKTNHNLDISDFLSDLEQQGFTVINRARSNYRYTYASLASALNFTYLDSVAQAQGNASQDMSPLIRMIERSRIADFLRRQGYRIVTFASGHTGTELKAVDARLAPLGQLTEFQNLVLKTTMLAGVVEFMATGWADELHARLIRYTFRELPRAVVDSRPSFVFAHVLCPHAPYVFDSLGNHPGTAARQAQQRRRTEPRASRRISRKARITAYGQQVQYLNRLVGEMVAQITGNSRRPAVIIIQGDHGPILLPGQFAVLNAIRIPPAARRRSEPALYDSLTPVNTFRVLLNQISDTNIALLPDRSYFNPLGAPYDFQFVEHPEEAQIREIQNPKLKAQSRSPFAVRDSSFGQ